MPTIHETEVFATWMSKLRDERAKAKIAARIDRLAQGNAGDVAPVGRGVSECAFTLAQDTACTLCSSIRKSSFSFVEETTRHVTSSAPSNW
jgi:hypothetical protein